jgi:hypothetical protein
LSAGNASAVVVADAPASPALVARTVMSPGTRVARTDTRATPASRSRNELLIESIFPLL